tara:strand:- start:154 stop:375 length:222 start_codon:yes stop_codon:yes gene_type:complete
VTIKINKKLKNKISFFKIKLAIAPIKLAMIINLNHLFPSLSSSFVDFARKEPRGIAKTKTKIPMINLKISCIV